MCLELIPDQSTSLGSLGLGGQGWHKTTLAVAILTIYILQVTSWGHLGLGDSSGAVAGMLDLQALGSVPTFTLTNDGLSMSSSVQRGYNLLTITEFMKTLEKCKLKKKTTPEVLVVPDLLVQYSRYTDEETGHRKDVTSDDTVGCGQTCWESCSVVSYEGMCNCPMSSASA